LPSTEALAQIFGLADNEIPLVRLPGGPELRNPSAGEVSRALGIGLELEQAETVDLLVVGGGPAGLGAAVYGASEGAGHARGRGQRSRRPGGNVARPRREVHVSKRRRHTAEEGRGAEAVEHLSA
jgi:hypothetical protein